jgi:hypothetical protein
MPGAIGVLGQTVLSSVREAELSKIDDLVKQAMLDPQIARTLLIKAPERANSGSAMKLAQQLRRLTVFETGKPPERSSNEMGNGTCGSGQFGGGLRRLPLVLPPFSLVWREEAIDYFEKQSRKIKCLAAVREKALAVVKVLSVL